MTKDTTSEPTAAKMQYVRLGKTGLQVSKLCLGMMSYGIKEWQPWVVTEDEAMPIIGKAWELGINFWDTANVYSNGISETITGHAIQRFNIPRDRIVVATKVRASSHPDEPTYSSFGKPPRPGTIDINRAGLSRKCIMQEVEGSLKRLGTDYIDLYQIHRWDYDTPIEETMSTLHDLVRIGKVRYIGASSMYAWQFSKAQYVAEARGWDKFVSMQNYYNLIYREEEREMIPLCEDQGVGMIPWSPLAAGALTGKNRGTIREKQVLSRGMVKGPDEIVIDRVIETAEKKGASNSQVALAWMYTKKYIHSPIVGISKMQYLYDLVGALDVKLTPEEVKYLEEPYVPKAIFGHM